MRARLQSLAPPSIVWVRMDPPPTAQKRKKTEADEDSQQQVAIEHLLQQVASMRQALAAATEQFELRCKGRANRLDWTVVSVL